MPVHIAVAIVGYQDDKDIVRCVDALSRCTYRDFEIVVCENGGRAAYEKLIAVLPSRLVGGQLVRVLKASHNLGFAGGTNVCLQASSSADAWWVLNPDTIPRADALAAMVVRLQRADCDAVGATIQLDNGLIQSFGGHWSPWFARAVSIGKGASIKTAVDAASIERMQNYLNGASMLISKRFLSNVGLMRDDYFLYCEEVEWCLRALRKGMRLGFAQDAFVIHHQGSTTGAGGPLTERSRLSVYLMERNKILLTRDLFPGKLWIAITAALFALLLRTAKQLAWRQLGYGLSGWLAGIHNERDLPGWMRQKL